MAMAFESQSSAAQALQDGSSQTKTCPRCGAQLFADMDVCYGCLYDFTRPGLAYPGSGMAQENSASGQDRLATKNAALTGKGALYESARSEQPEAFFASAPATFAQNGSSQSGLSQPRPSQASLAGGFNGAVPESAAVTAKRPPSSAPHLSPSQAELPQAAPSFALQSAQAPSAYSSPAIQPFAAQQPGLIPMAELGQGDVALQKAEQLGIGLAVRWRGLEAVLSLTSRALTVGSDRANDITLYDFSLPSQCLRIQALGEGVVVELADPQTRALVDGVPLQQQTVLKPGQVLDLSGARFSLVRISP